MYIKACTKLLLEKEFVKYDNIIFFGCFFVFYLLCFILRKTIYWFN